MQERADGLRFAELVNVILRVGQKTSTAATATLPRWGDRVADERSLGRFVIVVAATRLGQVDRRLMPARD